ncbi:RluA family pseudouridine synthase [Sphingobium cloacae]|uniref:Pseudouridylate synthase n=1 Tax=Sphingobium cloacae TaxID=120107 RepID=A0A1E1F0M7_9SPHN|nr:RNA pseudouridine synthase [Sphingobium cloacae]BAV64054.1 pseudouridylate synthase [Sphingobium cloacae]
MSLLNDKVLFIDGEAIILNKPAGLPVDAPRDGSLSLENYLSSLTFGFQRWPLAVHRLDRDTSGCLLLARNPKAHKRFAAAFEAGTVTKRYVAVVEGVPSEESGIIDLPLKKISSVEKGWRMVADRSGKSAVTHWRRISEKDGRALIAFMPRTGRTHQIRVHALQGLGAAIVGDPVYGNAGEPMLLHSRFLSIPRNAKPAVEATAPLPATFAQAGFGEELLDDAA